MPPTAQVRRTAVADQKIPLRVFLLGRIAAYHGERLIPPRVEPSQRRDTFQITNPRSAAPAREQAIEILLPEREPERSAKAFNTVLHDLRRALSPRLHPTNITSPKEILVNGFAQPMHEHREVSSAVQDATNRIEEGKARYNSEMQRIASSAYIVAFKSQIVQHSTVKSDLSWLVTWRVLLNTAKSFYPIVENFGMYLDEQGSQYRWRSASLSTSATVWTLLTT